MNRNESNVRVNAEIDVAESSTELVNANIRTEQQLNLGHHAIRVLTGEKRDEIGEIMSSTRKRISELTSEVNDAEDAAKKLIKKHADKLKKKAEAMGKSLAQQVFSAACKSVSTAYSKAYLAKNDDDDNPKETQLNQLEANLSVSIDTHGTNTPITIKVTTGGYSRDTIALFEIEHDAPTKKALEKLRELQAQKDEAVAFGSQLQEALQAVDKYERKLELDLSKSALRHSEDGAAILEALRKVAFPNPVPALPWSGKRK